MDAIVGSAKESLGKIGLTDRKLPLKVLKVPQSVLMPATAKVSRRKETVIEKVKIEMPNPRIPAILNSNLKSSSKINACMSVCMYVLGGNVPPPILRYSHSTLIIHSLVSKCTQNKDRVRLG